MKPFAGCPSVKLCKKQNATKSALKAWNRNVFGLCQSHISELTQLIMGIQGKEMFVSNAQKEAKLQGELNEWLARYDTIWKQKSREIWLRDGDRNTKLFHLSTIIRRRHNAINAIRNDAGGWILDKKEIGQHIREKFKVLFTEEEISCPLTSTTSCPL